MRLRTLGLAVALAIVVGGVAAAQGLGNGSNYSAPPGAVAPAGSGAVVGGGSAQLFAVINVDGTISRDKGAVSALGEGNGGYEVIFARNIRNCVYTATIGLSGSIGTADTGFVTVVGLVGNVNGVFVKTADKNGDAANRPFHLWINC